MKLENREAAQSIDSNLAKAPVSSTWSGLLARFVVTASLAAIAFSTMGTELMRRYEW